MVRIKMQSIRPFIIYLQLCRHIGSSSACSNFNRESRFIKKMISGSRKPKAKWYNNINAHNITEINPTNKPLSIHTVHRMTIRNKLFMEHITDQLSMGEISDIGENIEITDVKITADFKYVNVFWIRSNNVHRSVNEEALQQCSKIIRHNLSELRVIGVVPPIQFIENKQYLITREVNTKLAIIDENLESWSEQNTDPYSNSINQTLHSQTEQAIHNSKAKDSCIELPIMRHDVLGLDHYKIMSQIINSLSKAKKASQKRLLDMKTDTDNNSCHIKSKNINFLTQKEQEKIFSDFLIKRRKEEKHKYRTKLHEQEMLDNLKEDIKIDYEEHEDNNMCKNEFDKEE